MRVAAGDQARNSFSTERARALLYYPDFCRFLFVFASLHAACSVVEQRRAGPFGRAVCLVPTLPPFRGSWGGLRGRSWGCLAVALLSLGRTTVARMCSRSVATPVAAVLVLLCWPLLPCDCSDLRCREGVRTASAMCSCAAVHRSWCTGRLVCWRRTDVLAAVVVLAVADALRLRGGGSQPTSACAVWVCCPAPLLAPRAGAWARRVCLLACGRR